MLQSRWWLAAAVVWTAALFNVERVHEPINIASFVYVFAAAIAAALVVVRPAARWPWPGLLAGTLAAFLVAKAALGYRIAGPALTLTVTEGTVLTVTLLVFRRLAAGLGEFEQAAGELMVLHLDDRSRPFDETQGELYREVCRARRFDRRLTLVSIACEPGEEAAAVHRLIREAQRKMADRYAKARIADVIGRELRDSDLLTYDRGRFVALLPETDGREARAIAGRLKAAAREQLGVGLRCGLASFPDEEVTFSGLLDQAEARLRAADLSDEPDGEAVGDTDDLLDGGTASGDAVAGGEAVPIGGVAIGGVAVAAPAEAV